MATIGRHEGIAEFPSGLRLTGFIGWVAWLGLHLLYLIGFRNRANVMVNWAWNYLTFGRGSRILSRRHRAGAGRTGEELSGPTAQSETPHRVRR